MLSLCVDKLPHQLDWLLNRRHVHRQIADNDHLGSQEVAQRRAFFSGGWGGGRLDRCQWFPTKQCKGRESRHTIVVVMHVAPGNLQLSLEILDIFLDGHKLVDVGFVLVEFCFYQRPMRTHGPVLHLVTDGSSHSHGSHDHRHGNEPGSAPGIRTATGHHTHSGYATAATHHHAPPLPCTPIPQKTSSWAWRRAISSNERACPVLN